MGKHRWYKLSGIGGLWAIAHMSNWSRTTKRNRGVSHLLLGCHFYNLAHNAQFLSEMILQVFWGLQFHNSFADKVFDSVFCLCFHPIPDKTSGYSKKNYHLVI